MKRLKQIHTRCVGVIDRTNTIINDNPFYAINRPAFIIEAQHLYYDIYGRFPVDRITIPQVKNIAVSINHMSVVKSKALRKMMMINDFELLTKKQEN